MHTRTQTSPINVTIAGLGGQGVLKASDILADAAARTGCDVKKSELHGMSQRGGSVASDVRFGAEVFSPMVPRGQADYLVVLAADQIEPNRHMLRDRGVLIDPSWVDEASLTSRRCINVALLGVLSRCLDIAPEHWQAALQANLPDTAREANLQAFELGRNHDQTQQGQRVQEEPNGRGQ
jgi:indolepyruvate ferredoxin oxidoreductase, beta subunit